MTEFIPIKRMKERVALARDEADTAYFFDLLYLGELILKIHVVEALAALRDDRDRHRYSLEYRLLRADGIGEWASVLDEALVGPASQVLSAAGRDAQQMWYEVAKASEDTWQRRSVDLLNQACRCLDGNYDDLSRVKVTLRQWVRQFVWMRNRTRGHGAPKAATLSAICPVLEKSINEIIENSATFRRSWVHIRRSLSGKYRVSTFGGSRSPFAHLGQESTHSLMDGTYIYMGEPCWTPLFLTDPDLSDFYLPNGNHKNSRYEVISYITDERRIEDGSHYLLPVEAQPASETSAAPALDVVGELFSNMPPSRTEYVPREELEAELQRILCDDRHPVVTLQGRGGIGKTSLALTVLHEIARRDSFFAIVWFSARDIDLLPDGPRLVRADVLSVEDVARDFATLVSPGNGLKGLALINRLTDSLSGKVSDGPFIFVFDNFETIREQSELYAYLSNAVRLPNKVLITTRARDFKADYPIEVRGLARNEYRSLVGEVAKRLSIVELLDSEYEEQLYEESDGHPYITKVLLGEVAHERRQVSLKRLVASKETTLDALFDRSFSALTPAGQRVFLTLCSWRSLVPRVGLEAVLLRPGNEHIDVERSLMELMQLSLVEELPSSGGAAFLSVPLAAALFGKRKLVTSPAKIAIEADLELVRGFGAATTTDMTRGLGPRIDRLVSTIARRVTDDVDLSQELAVVKYIAAEYPPAWLKLADLQVELGRSIDAIDSTNRYLESCPTDQDGWKRLVELYRAAGDFLGEMHARLQLIATPRVLFADVSSSASRLNALLSRQEIALDADERRLMVGKLRAAMESRLSEADATDFSRLAWVCIYAHDREAAEKWADRGLSIDPENSHCLRLKSRLTSGRVDVE